MRAGLRGDFTGHRRFLDDRERGRRHRHLQPRRPAVADARRAGRPDPPVDAVFVVDNASTDHTRDVLVRDDLSLRVVYSEDNLGERAASTGVQARTTPGTTGIWLMDDDVVPVPTCLEVLLGHDEACLAAVREDVAGRLVEKAAVEFDLRNPMIRPKRGSVDSTTPAARRCRSWSSSRTSPSRGSCSAASWWTRSGCPTRRTSSSYDDVDYAARPARRPASGGARRGPRAAARLRPAARPRRVEGVLHVPEPLRRALPLRRERPGPAQALRDRPRGRAAQPAARGRAEAANVVRASGRPGACAGCRAPIVGAGGRERRLSKPQ